MFIINHTKQWEEQQRRSLMTRAMRDGMAMKFITAYT
jgi:hypothetical protein